MRSVDKSYIRYYSPCLPVTDDELSLASTDGYKWVDGLDAGLHGLPHRDTGDDTRRLCSHTGPVIYAHTFTHFPEGQQVTGLNTFLQTDVVIQILT